ncbi:MAG: YdeI/OmpD-associated family protein [Cyanobacteria bacterium P01_F01_bin.150]
MSWFGLTQPLPSKTFCHCARNQAVHQLFIDLKAFPASTKRDILRWIKLAKKPETRTRRIQKTATLAAENKRASGTR